MRRLRAVLTSAGLSLTLALSAPAAAAPPQLGARAAALIDASSGQRLYGLNAATEVPIASTTKLMTALIALERARPAQLFTYPGAGLSSADSQIGLSAGERMTVRDLLIALLLPSADDAAQDLAYNIGRGSVARFVTLMNARAAGLGLSRTHYSTPIGLDTPGNYSTAWDLLSLARYLLRTHPFFRQVVALPSAVLSSGAARREVENRNDLVGKVPWVNGVKTGHTIDAGYVLVAAGTRHGMSLISVVLGTDGEEARDASSLALLDYGFSEFRAQTPVTAGQPLAAVRIHGWPKRRAQLVAAATFRHVFARSEKVRTIVQAPHELVGPQPGRGVVGAVIVMTGAKQVARIPLVLAAAVPAPPAGSIWRTFTLIAVAVLLAAATLVVARIAQRTRAERATENRPA